MNPLHALYSDRYGEGNHALCFVEAERISAIAMVMSGVTLKFRALYIVPRS